MTQQATKKTALEKTNRYLEIFWIVVTVFATGLAVYSIITDGWEIGKWYLILVALALAMYFFRRGFRKRFEKRRLEGAMPGNKKQGK